MLGWAVVNPPLMMALLCIGWTRRNIGSSLSDRLVLPLLYVVVGRSVLYDGWRHLFFYLPCFIMFAVQGWLSVDRLLSQGRISFRILSLFGKLTTWPDRLSWLPGYGFQSSFEECLFQPFAGPGMQEIKHNFELDYWGAVISSALEYILDVDRDPLIRFSSNDLGGSFNVHILPRDQARRLRYVEDSRRARYSSQLSQSSR